MVFLRIASLLPFPDVLEDPVSGFPSPDANEIAVVIIGLDFHVDVMIFLVARR